MAEGHSSQQPGQYFYCAAEGIELLKNIMVNDPRAHILTPQQYIQNVEAGTMPPMKNHNILGELAEKAMDPADQM